MARCPLRSLITNSGKVKRVRREGGSTVVGVTDRLVWWYVSIPLTLITCTTGQKINTQSPKPLCFFPKQSFPPLRCALTLKHRGVRRRNKLRLDGKYTGKRRLKSFRLLSERLSWRVANKPGLQTQLWGVFSKHRLWRFRKSTDRVRAGQAEDEAPKNSSKKKEKKPRNEGLC